MDTLTNILRLRKKNSPRYIVTYAIVVVLASHSFSVNAPKICRYINRSAHLFIEC